ncbi:MAG: phosphate/phosphite/phosphonate ABC transporter substrate-binding protein [Rhodovarius sp.]|nr:phosphate/phosphite/phosphonate ABC transporter substrate-binding protein [Rhodovarius sp.]MDW8315067.1 phosphate/phosphite/phosphonate ABC transporter substrate-binding protein [Rhodovarius sp.]
MLRRSLLGLALGLGLIAPAAAQPAQDCPRGALDVRYCDRDGDMVADTPTDPRQLVDPPVLVFAYTPVEDPSVYRRVFEGFLQHLSRVTGKRTQFFAVQSNAAQIEAMRAGRLHIAGFNTGGTPLAVNCAGFVPFAVMASRNGEFGYEMEIIVRADSPIQRMEDLRGRTLAFTSQTSNSGFRVPSALLRDQFNMLPDRDFRAAFSGSHQNSIIGVANRDYDAAAIANEVLFRMAARGVVSRDQFRTIYKSATFPTTGWGYAHNLTPELQARIREAFFSFEWEGSELAREFGNSIPPMQRFLPITYREHWEVVRQSDAAVGVQYRCQ